MFVFLVFRGVKRLRMLLKNAYELVYETSQADRDWIRECNRIIFKNIGLVEPFQLIFELITKMDFFDKNVIN